MYVLGIKCSGHDTGAALLSDKSGKVEISAISEARLNRRKHSYTYPLLSIRYVMDRFGIKSLDEIDHVCIDGHGELRLDTHSQFGRHLAKQNRSNEYDFEAKFNYLIEQTIKFRRDKVTYVNHVDAHAASAYYVSGFDSSAILTIEGGIGFYRGEGSSIKVIDRTGYDGDEYQNGEITSHKNISWARRRQNISNLYDLVTRKLGLDKFAAGKTMALAAFRHKFAIKNYLNIPVQRHDGFMTDYAELMFRLDREIPQFTPTDKSKRDTELLTEYWVNIAREVQDALEEDVLYLAKEAAEKSKSRNLCLAGGVALSCVTNRKILDLGLFDNVFVQPAASDEGIPLGCALWGYYKVLNGRAKATMLNAYLGTPRDQNEVPMVLEKCGLNYRSTTPAEVAQLLVNGSIIGRLSGGSEYGPRALGNRSILADPRVSNMLEIVNTQIKHRERYRPFAPSCQAEKQQQYFDLPCSSPFMLMACSVHPSERENIPAVIHVDGTSRVQSVTLEQNKRYYELIGEFGKLTGVFVLLNTSFNDDGEPIVENYQDAVLSFVRTGLHFLYIEDYLVERPDKHICEQLKVTLAKSIKERVADDYKIQIEKLCDSVKYRKLEESLSKFKGIDIYLSLRELVIKARLLKFEERESDNKMASSIKKLINYLSSVARHGESSLSVVFATLPLLCVYLITQFRHQIRR